MIQRETRRVNGVEVYLKRNREGSNRRERRRRRGEEKKKPPQSMDTHRERERVREEKEVCCIY